VFGDGEAGQHPAMRIALLTIVFGEGVMAMAFGVEWQRDRRRPPGRRRFGPPYKLYTVLAATVAMVCFTVAFAVND
jgi:hypothetical protein